MGSKFEFGNKLLLYETWIGELTAGSLFFGRRLIISEQEDNCDAVLLPLWCQSLLDRTLSGVNYCHSISSNRQLNYSDLDLLSILSRFQNPFFFPIVIIGDRQRSIL
jgi:hypothetical protein